MARLSRDRRACRVTNMDGFVAALAEKIQDNLRRRTLALPLVAPKGNTPDVAPEMGNRTSYGSNYF